MDYWFDKMSGEYEKLGSDDDGIIVQYKKELNRHSLLTEEDETALAKKMKEGDEKAREKLITSNLRLVIFIVAKYFSKSKVSFMDKVQIGNLALIQAVDKFDHTKGCRLSTYASYYIKYTVQEEIIKMSGPITIPPYVFLMKGRYKELSKSLGRESVLKEIAREFKVSPSKIEEKIKATTPSFILYDKINTLEICDSPPNEFFDDDVRRRSVVDELLKGLKPTERAVIEKRFFLDPPWKFREIGDYLNLSTERVRQIQRNTISNWTKVEGVVNLR